MSQSTQSVAEFAEALRASRQPEWAEAGFASYEAYAAHEAALMSTPVWVWIEWQRLWSVEGQAAADAFITSAPMIDEDGEEYYN
jgi:hypothetical protein